MENAAAGLFYGGFIGVEICRLVLKVCGQMKSYQQGGVYVEKSVDKSGVKVLGERRSGAV